MLVSILFIRPAWKSATSLQMFPDSCKYLLCALSVDIISDHKDISVFLFMSARRAVREFSCQAP